MFAELCRQIMLKSRSFSERSGKTRVDLFFAAASEIQSFKACPMGEYNPVQFM